MVFRPVGVYLLASSALYTQTRTTQQLTQMKTYAARAADLAVVIQTELESSAELQGKSAVDSEAGLQAQSKSLEMAEEAERHFALAGEETAQGENYKREAAEWREKAAEDASFSEEKLSRGQSLITQSNELTALAEQERAEAVINAEKAAGLLEQSEGAEEIALTAEEEAAGYESVALAKEAKLLRSGEAVAKKEAVAIDDAEVTAACTPIPFLDFFCDLVGGITEAGYQTAAAFEAARGAMASIAAAAARGKQRTELAIAAEKHAEAAKDVVEAERLAALEEEENNRAEGESEEAAREKAEGEEALAEGGEKKEQAEVEESTAALDEEKSAEFFAKAAEDEAIGAEDESSAAAYQTDSEELMSKSTEEEFSSEAEQADAESKQIEMEDLLKKSMGHGIHAFGSVVHAVATAGAVTYVVVTKTVVNVIVPNSQLVLAGTLPLAKEEVLEGTSSFLLHVGVVSGTAATALNNELLKFEGMSTQWRWWTLLILALVAGLVETVVVHSLSAAFSSHLKGREVVATITTTILTFFSYIVHLVPLVLMEALILLTLFGPGVFDLSYLSNTNPFVIWGALVLLIAAHIWFFKLKHIPIVLSKQSWAHCSTSSDWEEDFFCEYHNDEQQNILNSKRVNQEYGSMEEMTIIFTSNRGETMSSELSTRSSFTRTTKSYRRLLSGCIDKCSNAFHRYCKGLRLPLELLILSLMCMLIWHCWPVLKVLHPLIKTASGVLASILSWPFLIAVFVVVTIIVHFLFVH